MFSLTDQDCLVARLSSSPRCLSLRQGVSRAHTRSPLGLTPRGMRPRPAPDPALPRGFESVTLWAGGWGWDSAFSTQGTCPSCVAAFCHLSPGLPARGCRAHSEPASRGHAAQQVTGRRGCSAMGAPGAVRRWDLLPQTLGRLGESSPPLPFQAPSPQSPRGGSGGGWRRGGVGRGRERRLEGLGHQQLQVGPLGNLEGPRVRGLGPREARRGCRWRENQGVEAESGT